MSFELIGVLWFVALAIVCGWGVFVALEGITHPEKFPSLWEDRNDD